MNHNLPLNILMQAKGGVGKSVSAFVFAQYLRDCLGGNNVAFVDTDPSNNTFSRYKSLEVGYMNPTSKDPETGETKVDALLINNIFETVFNNTKRAILMDTGSSNYIDLKSYLEVNQIFEILASDETIGREVILHVPINGGADFSVCAKELGVMLQSFPTVKFVVWLNSYGGELNADGKEFSELGVCKTLTEQGRLLGVVLLPKLDPNAAKAFNEMLTSGLTFEEAKFDAGGKLNILRKTQIERLRQRLYLQLDDAFPEYAELRQKEGGSANQETAKPEKKDKSAAKSDVS